MFTNLCTLYHVTASRKFNHEITVRAQMEVCDVCCYSSPEFLCYDCSRPSLFAVIAPSYATSSESKENRTFFGNNLLHVCKIPT